MNDPVKDLASVVRLAEERQMIGSIFRRQRTLHESDVETLNRMVAERDYVVALLDKFFEGRPNPFKEPFDFQYKELFKGAMQHVFAMAELGRLRIESEKTP